MNAYHALEWLVVIAAVGGSAWAVWRRLRPRAKPASGGCSSCSSCGSCDTPAPRSNEQPARWHR